MELSGLLEDGLPVTVLAGAGLSAAPPTCLPGWWALNDAVLGALGGALERVTGRPGLSDGFRGAIRQRRDTTRFLMPDLQAQLLEDELGPAYFQALTSVDSGDTNAAHHLLAELARQGRLGAVLTTNFDCTIERAFRAAGVAYRLYASPGDFERLDEVAAPVPIVKIHGSADRPETMVDTLRQRLQGRSAALEQWLHRRFTRFPTIGVGFSCEDLQYDPDYLEIRPAARDGARFCFLVREGEEPSAPLQRLAAELPQRVFLAAGVLPAWLFEVARALGAAHAIPEPTAPATHDVAKRRARAAQRLEESLAAWAASLGPMNALNAVTALLTAAGHRHDADHLSRRMWKFYRAPDDCTGPAYARYLHNRGEVLLRQGRFHNGHDPETDFVSWKAAADLGPRQFFDRAVREGGTEHTRARALLCEFLAGGGVRELLGRAAGLLETLSAP
ncbi:MAG TPA: SIR2 family protein, partial [Longimicrobiaceae bacterium]